MDDKDIDSIIAERQKELSVLSGSSLPPKKSVGKTDDIANVESKDKSEAAPPGTSTSTAPEKESLSEIIATNLANQAKTLTKEDAAAMGAGAFTGYALPKAIEGYKPGTVASPENEIFHRQNLEKLQQERVKNPFQTYVGTSENLLQQQQQAVEQFKASQERLNQARMNAEMLKSASINDLLPPEFRTTPTAPEHVLTRQPIGGEATGNYAQKFGLTPLESLEAPSMSKVQQKIPGVAESIVRAQRVGPEFGKFGESPLLLGPEGQKTALEQKRAQTIDEQNRLAMEEEHKRMLAQQKAKAQIDFENAQRQHELHMKALRDVNAAMQTHISSGVPPTISAEEERLRKETSRFGGGNAPERILSFLGRKVMPRFSPVLAGAMAPEQAAAAKEAHEKGDYGRMMAHGVGALGSAAMATGIPIASGLGMVANIPSLYYEAEDLMKPPPKKP